MVTRRYLMVTLTINEAADYMKVCLSTFKKTIKRDLPYIKLGRRVLYDQKDLDKYLESKKVAYNSDVNNKE